MAHILVVDDEPAVRNVLEEILIRSGHDIFLANCGLVALKTLSERQVDLVITDIVMPYMTGVKLIDEIRTLYPRIKILAISGGGSHYQSDTCVTVAKEHGADRSMKKPFVLKELSVVIEDLLASIKL